MKKIFLLSAIAMTAGLYSCSNDDLIEDGAISRSNEIVMNPILKNATRATAYHDIATDNLGTFCVTAYHGDDMYFENVDYIRSGSNWLASNKYYWPEEGSLTFYSYAPREDENGIERTGFNTFTVTQQSIAADQPDFIVSKTTRDKARSSAGVTINFRHAMSRIALRVKNSNTGIKMNVTDWKIGNLYNKGSFTLADENTDDHNYRLLDTDWNLTGDGCSQSIETEIINSAVTAYTVEPGSAIQQVTGFKDFIAIPQQLVDAPNYTSGMVGAPFAGSYIAVEMEILNAEDEAVIADRQWCYWPIATEWKSGNRYTYTIDLSSGGFKGRNTDDDGTGGGSDDGDDELDPVLKGSEISFVNCRVDEWDEMCENVKMPDLTKYLCFTALQNSSITLKKYGSTWTRDVNVEYTFDKETWTPVEFGTSISVSEGQTVYFRGDNPHGFSESSSNYVKFSSTGSFEAHGNVMTLIDPLGKEKIIPNDYCFIYLLSGTTITTAPELPATTITAHSYESMFNNCKTLTEAPEIPATTVGEYCCYNMFQYCTSLVKAPTILPATKIAPYCYAQMFEMCMTNMTVPELPAMEMEDGCYFSMFRFTLIRTAPELPAMKLADRCYANMFAGCQVLTKAPVLPAEEIVGLCYGSMFNEATRLNYVKAMFLTVPDNSGMNYWLNQVAASGTFVKNPNATWKGAFIPGAWTIITADEE